MRILTFLLSLVITSELVAQNNQTRWLTFHNTELNDFSQVNTTELKFEIQTEYDSTDEYSELYQPFFIESPKRTKLIDIDSYGLLLEEENGKLVTYGGSPDTEVLLVDLTNNQQSRLAFYGTAVIVEDAYWVNDNIARIFQIDVGFTEFRLEFVEYDFNRLTITLWTSNRTFLNYQNSYNEQVRLSSVTFK